MTITSEESPVKERKPVAQLPPEVAVFEAYHDEGATTFRGRKSAIVTDGYGDDISMPILQMDFHAKMRREH